MGDGDLKLELRLDGVKPATKPKATWTRSCGADCDALLERHGRTRKFILDMGHGVCIGAWREAEKPARCKVCAEMTVRQVETFPFGTAP